MLINNYCDFDVEVVCDKTEKIIKKKSSLNLNFKSGDGSIVLKPKHKHKVKFNPILYVFTLDPNDIECEVMCCCDLDNIGENEVLISLHQRLEVCDEIKYFSVVAENENGLIDCKIRINDINKLKRKYYFYQLMFVARIYLFPPALYFSICESNLFILLVLTFFFFGILIPCFKRLIRFNKDCKQDFNELFKLEQSGDGFLIDKPKD